jgi:hypothetical protein
MRNTRTVQTAILLTAAIVVGLLAPVFVRSLVDVIIALSMVWLFIE